MNYTYNDKYIKLRREYMKEITYGKDKEYQEKLKNEMNNLISYVKDEQYENTKEFLENLTFFNDVENIPLIPHMRTKEDYEKYVVKNFIRCGAIQKDKLEIGKTYKGTCRNSDKATWNGKQFEYDRYKFGTTYKDKINHFEDDDGYDLFVPLKVYN